MSREYKFRGKRVDNDKWVYGDLIHLGWNEYICPQNMHNLPSMGEMYRHHVISDTIGQYTGLHDCEGREIYEGDIVEFINTDFPNMVVRYDNGSFMLCEEEFSTFTELRMNYTVEVIGNIYDNPELLEGGK